MKSRICYAKVSNLFLNSKFYYKVLYTFLKAEGAAQ